MTPIPARVSIQCTRTTYNERLYVVWYILRIYSRAQANPDKLNEYHFNVIAPIVRREDIIESKIETEAQRKMNYLRHEMVKELHPRNYKHVGYWLTILMMLAVFYVRQFSHGVGQSLYLSVRPDRSSENL